MEIPKAVYPPRGAMVHLYLPNYAPGPKPRDSREQAMCGASVHQSVPPPVGPIPTGRKHVPLAEAVASDAFLAPGPNDPRPMWRWCAVCLGRAVDHYELAAVVLDHIIEKGRGW